MPLSLLSDRARASLGSYVERWIPIDRVKAIAAQFLGTDEFAQGLLRVLIGGIVLAYLAWSILGSKQVHAEEAAVLAVAVGFFVFGAAMALHIRVRPNSSPVRRFIGMVADNAVTTFCLVQMGERGAFVLFVYLFITFGNGFRFGRLYLYSCQLMSMAGFGLVYWFTPFWKQHPAISGALFISLLILPLYVGSLSEQIKRERKRADEANRAKGRFLATISHEMRTPLNGVIAMSDVLRETDLNESQREIVNTLGTSAHLLLAQIEDVLDMAKIEAGRVQIERKPFDLGKLLTSIVKVVLPQARYKDLAVNTEISPQAMRWFLGDSHHLRQVVLNLLANAIKFTERGQVTLRALVLSDNPEEARIRVEVQDTGIGIPPLKQVEIFEPFAQADNSITRIYGGTGLGTAIARQLVSLMGGKIGVISTVGLGSTFWFEVPLPYAEPIGIDLTTELADTARMSATAAALAGQQGKVTKLRGARILVAEDNPTNQRVTQLILESGGHRVTIVDNGEAALDALELGSYDLALFDLSMPVVSGLEALKLYKFTTSKPIPVLILSANVTTEIIADCQTAGCAEFIPKPIRATILLDAIERHLAERADAIALTAPPKVDDRPTLTVVDTPLIEYAVLEDLGKLSTDPTFVERLVRGFRSDSDRLVKAIGDALAARRYQDAKDAAHALKGGAGSVGATQLVQFAVRLEKATHDILRTKAASLIEELGAASTATNVALEKHLEERRRKSNS